LWVSSRVPRPHANRRRSAAKNRGNRGGNLNHGRNASLHGDPSRGRNRRIARTEPAASQVDDHLPLAAVGLLHNPRIAVEHVSAAQAALVPLNSLLGVVDGVSALRSCPQSCPKRRSASRLRSGGVVGAEEIPWAKSTAASLPFDVPYRWSKRMMIPRGAFHDCE
jgi:hypothetical protein